MFQNVYSSVTFDLFESKMTNDSPALQNLLELEHQQLKESNLCLTVLKESVAPRPTLFLVAQHSQVFSRTLSESCSDSRNNQTEKKQASIRQKMPSVKQVTLRLLVWQFEKSGLKQSESSCFYLSPQRQLTSESGAS